MRRQTTKLEGTLKLLGDMRKKRQKKKKAAIKRN